MAANIAALGGQVHWTLQAVVTALVCTAAVVATSLLERTDLIRSARNASRLMGKGTEHSGHTVGQVAAAGT